MDSNCYDLKLFKVRNSYFYVVILWKSTEGQNELLPGAINPDFALFYGSWLNVYITDIDVFTTIVKKIKKSII